MKPREAAIGLVLALMAAMMGYVALAMHSTLGELRGLAATRDHDLRIKEPVQVSDMSKITRTKTVGEETISLTCCQMEGESYEDFLRRCGQEWKALCEAVGG